MYLCIFLKELKLLIPTFHQTCLGSEVYTECCVVLSSVKEQPTTLNWKHRLVKSEFLQFMKGWVLQIQPITSNNPLLLFLMADIILRNIHAWNCIQGFKNQFNTFSTKYFSIKINDEKYEVRRNLWRLSGANIYFKKDQL